MGLFYDIIMKQGYYEALMNGKTGKSTKNSAETAKKIKE